MQTQTLDQMRQSVQAVFADEIMDFKKDFDREFLNKTEAKDAIHKVIDKERDKTRHCEHCGSLRIVKNGKTPAKRQKYMCKDCGKSYSDTRNSITASSKKPYHVWESFIACMMNELSVRKTASMVGVAKNTAHDWRLKVAEAMRKYDRTRQLKGDIQMDETYFLLNLKGLKKLPRTSKKRGTKSQRRGLSTEQISVLTAIDSNDQILIEIAGQGNPKASAIIETLDDRIEKGSVITTDSKTAYIQVASHYNAELHQIPAGFHSNGIHNLGAINELHSSLKNWLVKFNGVSTRHLERYLAWFRFKRLLNFHHEVDKHNRITMNNSIKENVKFLIKSIHSAPFPIDIFRPYS